MVLGTAQDGGYPHLGCQKPCCQKAWKNPTLARNVVSLALIDPITKKWWLFKATPDIKQQLQLFKTQTKNLYPYLPEGIFITHAHIGHYAGLMEFGREVMATKNLKVYTLPRLKTFLTQNGPWSQLVKLHNIQLEDTFANQAIKLPNATILPFTVPHRDEFSETAGFKIETSSKKYLFIPDINKWSIWEKNIVDEVKKVDIAFLDATFSATTELDNRAISEVPHPLVSETQALFKNEENLKKRIFFIHLNHTNPLLWDEKAKQALYKSGFNLAKQGEVFK